MEGSGLFYPDDVKEIDAVMEFWNKTYPIDFIYIGISDNLAKGVYESIDGLPIEDIYNSWRKGEPNDADGDEDCVVLDRRDLCLNDDICDKKMPFICKKTQVSVEWNIACDLPYSGYKYNAALGRCYKFHLVAKSWTDAHTICRAEQSYLAIINNQLEADYLVNITADAAKDKAVNLDMAGAVYLGFHNLRDENWKSIRGYKYNAALGRCYKFHLVAKSWTDAHTICRAEQSYLAIINNQLEANYLVNITADAAKDKAVNLDMAGAVYLGFHNLRDENWKSIRGMTLEESGYDKWSHGQPDGNGREKCGSMFYDGELNDMLCSLKCFFICEHEIPLLSTAIDDRFDNTVY